MAKSLLVKDDELITIITYYSVATNKYNIKHFKILEEDKAKELLAKGDTSVDSLTTKWIVPTWNSSSYVLRSSTFYNPADGNNRLDWSKYQENLFKTCLKEWDVTDNYGQPVPLSLEAIGSLPKDIAYALLDAYEKAISLEDDERKK
jgi:hypothetical protein